MMQNVREERRSNFDPISEIAAACGVQLLNLDPICRADRFDHSLVGERGQRHDP
jgi:hypothetical protein